MTCVKIPLGIESFAEMRDKNFYYIDKTPFIKEILNTEFKVNLITRPRRFGKSLTMSMLEDFFDISKDSKSYFSGLAISKETETCDKWMNQYPVVFISLKDIDGNTFDEAFAEEDGEDKKDTYCEIKRNLKASAPYAAFKRWIVRDHLERYPELRGLIL